MGVPVVIGEGGVERVIEIDLQSGEKKALKKSLEDVKALIKAAQL